jgi:hypothetical protein
MFSSHANFLEKYMLPLNHGQALEAYGVGHGQMVKEVYRQGGIPH